MKPHPRSFFAVAALSMVLPASPVAALPGDREDPATGPHELVAEGLPDGIYWFDPDASGPTAAFQGAYFGDEGGGWLMVLNYVHKGGTNPSTQVRVDDTPLFDSNVLGTDESATRFWGHAAPSLLSQFRVTELRFYAVTSNHGRMIHFATHHPATIEYAVTGAGNTLGLNERFNELTGHTARLPATADQSRHDKGDFALTEYPFWESGCCTWGIGGYGKEDAHVRWEVDDSRGLDPEDPPGFKHDTIHRVWIRTAHQCGNAQVEPGEQCDDGNTLPGDGCNSRCGNEHGYVCDDEPSVCLSECGDGLIARDEDCDDGNLSDGDGCSAVCGEEPAWTCGGEPSECTLDETDPRGRALTGRTGSQCTLGSREPDVVLLGGLVLSILALRRRRDG